MYLYICIKKVYKKWHNSYKKSLTFGNLLLNDKLIVWKWMNFELILPHTIFYSRWHTVYKKPTLSESVKSYDELITMNKIWNKCVLYVMLTTPACQLYTFLLCQEITKCLTVRQTESEWRPSHFCHFCNSSSLLGIYICIKYSKCLKCFNHFLITSEI